MRRRLLPHFYDFLVALFIFLLPLVCFDLLCDYLGCSRHRTLGTCSGWLFPSLPHASDTRGSRPTLGRAELPPLPPRSQDGVPREDRVPGRYLLSDEREHSRLLGFTEADAVQGTLAPAGDGCGGLVHGAQPGIALGGITQPGCCVGFLFTPLALFGVFSPILSASVQAPNLPTCTH